MFIINFDVMSWRIEQVYILSSKKTEIIICTFNTFFSWFVSLRCLIIRSVSDTAPSGFCYRYASIPVYEVPLAAPWQCNLGAALLWPLQLYWFTLICRGAVRLVTGRSGSPE